MEPSCSLLMLVDDIGTVAGWLGATARGFLLVGDFGATERPSRLLAVLLAVGNGTLFVWFGWAGPAQLLCARHN